MSQGNQTAPAVMRIGLIGYGEVGKIFAQALVERGVAWVGTYDILLKDAAKAPAMRTHAEQAGIAAIDSAATLLERADMVISAVTASQTLAVATEAAASIRPGTWFLDVNSASCWNWGRR